MYDEHVISYKLVVSFCELCREQGGIKIHFYNAKSLLKLRAFCIF